MEQKAKAKSSANPRRAAQPQKRTRGVSSEPIVSAVESCDCFRDIENLNCVAYAKAAGTPTDARAKQ